MATRGTIAVQHTDGTVSEVYSHWDNYLGGTGQTLKVCYNSLALAEKLVALGDISSLRERIEPLGTTHTFDTPENDVTIFYGRDRSETDVDPKTYASLSEYLENGGGQEYDYIFLNGEWYVSCWATKDTATGYVALDVAASLEKSLDEEE